MEWLLFGFFLFLMFIAGALMMIGIFMDNDTLILTGIGGIIVLILMLFLISAFAALAMGIGSIT